ncbi:MAG: hypothetical protein ACP5MD_11415, partial [Verrucomicrobiia bacterium]
MSTAKSTASPARRPDAPAPSATAPGNATTALFRGVDWAAFLISTVFTLPAYLYTLAPDLTLEDCGELAVASYYA